MRRFLTKCGRSPLSLLVLALVVGACAAQPSRSERDAALEGLRAATADRPAGVVDMQCDFERPADRAEFLCDAFAVVASSEELTDDYLAWVLARYPFGVQFANLDGRPWYVQDIFVGVLHPGGRIVLMGWRCEDPDLEAHILRGGVALGQLRAAGCELVEDRGYVAVGELVAPAATAALTAGGRAT